jgi:hypothetical protein
MNMTVTCADLRARLRDQWLSGVLGDETAAPHPWRDGSPFPAAPDPVAEPDARVLPAANDAVRSHLATCPDCRRELDSIVRLDDSLRAGLRLLATSVPAPAEERIDRVLETLREEAFEIRRLRRLRRGLRLVLWSAFFGFALLAACLLAVAVYRAILGG